jgi:hypothetical protein
MAKGCRSQGRVCDDRLRLITFQPDRTHALSWPHLSKKHYSGCGRWRYDASKKEAGRGEKRSGQL